MPRRRYPFQHKGPGTGLLSQEVLSLVVQRTNWNPMLICKCACVCRRMNELCKAELWKGFCLSRAPKMASDLLQGVKNDAVEIGWDKLGKLMICCSGCSSGHLSSAAAAAAAAHVVKRSRFSQTSGKSFLHWTCRSEDVLYVTDICEHLEEQQGEDLGFFRGVFKAFRASKTWKLLLERGVPLAEGVLCPFCRCKVWSLAKANLIPKSAYKRLGCFHDALECFICINGHLTGMCVLVPLDSDDDDVDDDDGAASDEAAAAAAAAHDHSNRQHQQLLQNGD